MFSRGILNLILTSSLALVVHFQKDIAEPIALLELIDRLTVHILGPAAEVKSVASLRVNDSKLEFAARSLEEIVKHDGLSPHKFKESWFYVLHVVLLGIEHEHFKHDLHALW